MTNFLKTYFIVQLYSIIEKNYYIKMNYYYHILSICEINNIIISLFIILDIIKLTIYIKYKLH